MLSLNHFPRANRIVDTPQTIDFSLTEKPGLLRLYGGPYSLSSPTCPTLFLRKQSTRSVTWETKLTFTPKSPRTEAGTVIWWNYLNNSSIGIRMSHSNNSQRILRFRSSVGEELSTPLESLTSDVKLFVECGDMYKLGYIEMLDDKPEENCIKWLGRVENDVMIADPKIGAPFTGTLLGLYAFGELEGCLTPADFHYAEFR